MAISDALDNDLLVVLDLHEYEAMGSDPSGNRQRFLSVWRQLAERYRSSPSEVVFELLNEPNRKLNPALWNAYLRDGLTVIRASNPNRTVVIGPGRSNSIRGPDELSLPPGDRNIIVTIHYEAFEFTHLVPRGWDARIRWESLGRHPGPGAVDPSGLRGRQRGGHSRRAAPVRASSGIRRRRHG